ncbi:pyridoxal phosphate-dependent aminotransferase [Cytophagaceae bacterium DM2B3-1]|uniref:Aminotransferase n=1 Tax=Xanthocytophaga flava TaxID=3048013 RepID=A0ABT7CDJ9_9BACT|nr:pyridoxal phosphate-dependent aminotransferase [Xanthocytophaga flavus]MDJ1491761.1 pyridoxal phosphate-dependent aminotransferase [Xanthocytophaga flavus]
MSAVLDPVSVLSDRVNAMAESATLAMTKKARELAAQGVKVISLSIGEPDFPTPQHIKDAAKKAIDDNFTQYTPVSGIADLRSAIAEKLRRDNNLDWKPENIVVSTGAKQSLTNVLLALLNPGDEVIIFSPYWVSYSEMVVLAEGVPVLVTGSLENDFKVTAEEFEAAITPRTKLVMFSSPCNPTGSVFTEEELRKIGQVVERHENIFVMADEIYEYIVFEGKNFSIGSIPSIKDRVITVNGCSKGYAMTGWRLGYIAAAKWIADACDKIQGQVTSGTCSITQKAAVAALTGPLDDTRKMAEAYRRRRDLVIGKLREIPGLKISVPQGAFYAFPDMSSYFGKSDGTNKINNADDLAMYLLNVGHVATVSGAAFGAPNCIRLSTAASDENLTEAISRIKTALGNLK